MQQNKARGEKKKTKPLMVSIPESIYQHASLLYGFCMDLCDQVSPEVKLIFMGVGNIFAHIALLEVSIVLCGLGDWHGLCRSGQCQEHQGADNHSSSFTTMSNGT